MKRYLSEAFTLVELLIVIALLGVIATIVIAAINPIEQANRASDAGMKADASQLLSAIQRYYSSHNDYPWNTCSPQPCTPAVATPEDPLPWTSADNVTVGLCGATGSACKNNTTQGPLISSLELQTAFLSKSWIGATNSSGTVTVANALMVGKDIGASSAVYVCWIPKANSNRQNLINSASTSNKMVDTTAAFSGGIPAPSTACTAPSGASQDWTTGKCSECVPE